MPSPFPGMDPYLEGSLWTSVHTQLAVEIQRQLMPLLRPRYVALTNERFVIATVEDESDEQRANIYPVVSALADMLRPARHGGVSAISAPLHLATVMPEVIAQITVEIRDASDRRLVTDIEILSPANKRGDGRVEYLARRQRLLLSPAHLMEIDLLRAGQRVPMRQPLPSVPYFVFLSRAEKRPSTDVWPVRLSMPLPTVAVPLLAGDADVPLDLQLAMSNVYDLAGYDLAVDYSGTPEWPLGSDDAVWAEGLLRQRGLRRGGE